MSISSWGSTDCSSQYGIRVIGQGLLRYGLSQSSVRLLGVHQAPAVVLETRLLLGNQIFLPGHYPLKCWGLYNPNISGVAFLGPGKTLQREVKFVRTLFTRTYDIVASDWTRQIL